jgi:hypothetical protein
MCFLWGTDWIYTYYVDEESRTASQSESLAVQWEWEPAESLPSREGVTNSVRPPFRWRGSPISKHIKVCKEENKVVGPDGARNQERLCCRGPAAIYWTGLEGELLATSRCASGSSCDLPIRLWFSLVPLFRGANVGLLFIIYRVSWKSLYPDGEVFNCECFYIRSDSYLQQVAALVTLALALVSVSCCYRCIYVIK